jgi:uncharacterized coiled-coil DUF342 family protein
MYKQREADINTKIQSSQEKRKKVLAERFERDKKPTKEGEGQRSIFD